jgi:hypothetical protein
MTVVIDSHCTDTYDHQSEVTRIEVVCDRHEVVEKDDLMAYQVLGPVVALHEVPWVPGGPRGPRVL